MNTNGQDAPKKNKSRWTGIVNANSTYRFFFFLDLSVLKDST